MGRADTGASGLVAALGVVDVSGKPQPQGRASTFCADGALGAAVLTEDVEDVEKAVGAKEKATGRVARATKERPKDSPRASPGFLLATMAKAIASCAMNQAIGATSALGRKK